MQEDGLPEGRQALLGFNEPNFPNQCWPQSVLVTFYDQTALDAGDLICCASLSRALAASCPRANLDPETVRTLALEGKADADER